MSSIPELCSVYLDPLKIGWAIIELYEIRTRWDITSHDQQNVKIHPYRLNKGYNVKFPEGYLNWQASNEGTTAEILG